MKKALFALCLAGFAMSFTACDDINDAWEKTTGGIDNYVLGNGDCNAPGYTTQMKALNKSVKKGTCDEKVKASNEYFDNNKDDLEAAFTNYSDLMGNNSAVCYLLTAGNLVEGWAAMDEWYTTLNDCGDDLSEEGKKDWEETLNKFSTLEGWNNALQAANSRNN